MITPFGRSPGTTERSEALPLFPVPADLAAQFDTVGQTLKPVLAVRTFGYGLASSSPFRLVTAEALGTLNDQQRRAAVVYLLGVALQQPQNRVFRRNEENAGGWLLSGLARRKLAWSVEQLGWLVRFVRVSHEQLDEQGLAKILGLVTAAIERSTGDLTPLRDDLVWLQHWMVEIVHTEPGKSPYWWWVDPKIETYAARLHTVLEQANTPTLAAHVLDGRDSFGPRARTAMLAIVEESVAVRLLSLLHAFGSTPRPSLRWRSRASELTERQEVLVGARALLNTALTQKDPVVPEGGWVEHWIHPDSQAIIRAALWAVSLADRRDGFTSQLRDLGIHYAQSAPAQSLSVRSMTVVNAVVAALAERANDQPPGVLVAALLAIRQRLANRTMMQSVDKSIAVIAEAAGVTPDELTEQAVPTYGLDRDGTLTKVLGEHLATVRASVIAGRTEVTMMWATVTGRHLKTVPAAVRRNQAEDLAGLQRVVKDIRRTLVPQRDRLDLLMATDRAWTPEAWQRDYVDHPLVGLFARSLIWCCGSHSGLPELLPGSGWGLRTADGLVVTPADTDWVRLWHPLGRPLDEVMAWRNYLIEAEVSQPFKQAFREIYLVTPAEEQTGNYSNRFAAHILRYRQAAALMRTRGWRTPGLGEDFDGGDAGEAIRDFGDWRASFYVELVGQAEFDRNLCATDQVRFEHSTPDGGLRGVTVSEVDPLVFSEAMRDVDLFVGVSSIGADPEWLDNTQHRHRTYWEEYSFGPLTSTANTRAESVQRIIPRSKIADQARVEGRFLVVDGKLRTYKIHLGSSNILMSPNDAYLCIVAKPAARPDVYLPFEDDGRLSVILSKAFLLAADDKITDPDILRQIAMPDTLPQRLARGST